jgi:transketolase
LALSAAAKLREQGCKIRVVSMPSQELFMKQDAAYRESVLPAACKNRVSIEAATTFGWARFVGDEGLSIGLDQFGASAPFSVLAEKFGFVPDAVVERVKAHFSAKCKCGCKCDC